jgi:P27 family predicted phage terminase small subunit
VPMPRKSLSEHALTGTKPQYVEPEAFVPSGRPKYPRGISGEAKAAFKRLVKMLEQRRSVTPGDQEILRLYAVLFDRHVRALAAIAEQGEICVYTRLNNRGEDVACERPNLWLKVAETCEAKMLACLSSLGLTPMNRGKVKITEEPKKPGLTFDDGLTDVERAILENMRKAAPVPEPDIDLNSIDETVVQ